MTVKSLGGVVAGLLCCSGVARSEDTSLVEKTYPVGELVTYFKSLTSEHGADALIAYVMEETELASWQGQGGEGTIEYVPLGANLVVNASPAIHEQVEQMLDAVRCNFLATVSVEVLIIRGKGLAEWLTNDFYLDIDFSPIASDARPHITYLDKPDRHRILECVQGLRNSHAIRAPQLSLFSGVEGVVEINNWQGYLTGVQIAKFEGQSMLVMRHDPITLGVRLTLLPRVSPDLDKISLDIQALMTTLVSDDTPFVPARHEPPEPRQGPIQAADLNTLRLKETLEFRVGQTAVLSGWVFKREQPGDYFLNWAKRLPVINEVMPPPTDDETVFLLVTPRIVNDATRIVEQAEEPVRWVLVRADQVPAKTPPEKMPAAEPEAQEPLYPERYSFIAHNIVCGARKQTPSTETATSIEAKPNTQQDVNKLLARYRDACQAGRHAEARKLARKALRLDPACFDKR